MHFQKGCITVAFLLLAGSILPAQNTISGRIDLDTARWEPMAYLSAIPQFTDLHTISYEHIIERAAIGEEGTFFFSTTLLPDKDQFYRIHFSKKDDPPASLIIGGKDHNHVFLLARKNAEIAITIDSGEKLINFQQIEGHSPNALLAEINDIASLLDTLDYYGSSRNREFIREAVNERLLSFADTCSHPLIAQYALHKAGKEGRNSSSMMLWIGLPIVAILVIALSTFVFLLKRKNQKNPIAALTIQERNIFALLKEGKSNKEIADECAVSVSTVKSHINNIYSKLKIKSRKEILDIGE